MGKQRNGRIDPNNKYVMALGAHEPPAPPEKELAEARGMKQTLWAAAIAIFIWVLILDPTYGWLHWRSAASPNDEINTETIGPALAETMQEETTAPTEEQKEIGFIAFLKKSNGRQGETMIDGETYRISPGDTIEVWGYSDFAEIKHIVYNIPEIHPLYTALPSISFEDGIGIFSLPDYPAGEYFHLYITVEDVDGNYSEYQQYILIYESNE